MTILAGDDINIVVCDIRAIRNVRNPAGFISGSRKFYFQRVLPITGWYLLSRLKFAHLG